MEESSFGVSFWSSCSESERSPLLETQKSLETLIKLASNPECLSSLLDGLTGCIQAIITVTEQVDGDRLDKLLTSLLNQIVQTCSSEISSGVSTYQKLTAFHHLTRILRVCVDILKTKHAGLLYCALCTVNHIVDACIIHEAHHLWILDQAEGGDRPAGDQTTGTDSRCHFNQHGSAMHKTDPGASCKMEHSENLQTHINKNPDSSSSPKVERSSCHFSKKSGGRSSKMRFLSHQDSSWSLRSIFTHIDGTTMGNISRDTSFIDGEVEMENSSATVSGSEPPQISVQSPLEVLTGSDPSLIVTILQDSINKHKQGLGRQKCTPSVRQMGCTHHCVQILSGRILTHMCQAQVIQQKMVKHGHIKVLVDALDPNHDPHLLCLVLQSLACIAMTPAHHQTLTEADVPDTLMQLLLPSDEWYYTNHSTRYARYVKYHAARILVYMGLFHRLGGRVNLFDLKPFEQVTSATHVLQMHYAEDSFIDQMALGKVLIRDADGRIYAGSLEGIILEIIQDCERELCTGSSSSQVPHYDQSLYGCRPAYGHRHLQNEPSSSSGVSSQPEETGCSLLTDLLKCPFSEYFFHTAPLVIHPIIILRLLCHKMFGNMLRRKTNYSSHNLSPPVVFEKEQCPPRPTNMASVEDGDGTRETSAATKRRRANLHVQISTPGQFEASEEDLRLTRRRTKRAGSIDKHLMRLNSAKRHAASATMTNALKSIGDSLMTPLDLNISPPSANISDDWVKKKYSFRFPSLKKRSRSQGYIAGIQGSMESFTTSNKSSAVSLSHQQDEMLELTKELINLPTFEMDTHRMDQSMSPLLSRCSSVPELDHAPGGLGLDTEYMEPVQDSYINEFRNSSTCLLVQSRNKGDKSYNSIPKKNASPIPQRKDLCLPQRKDIATVLQNNQTVSKLVHRVPELAPKYAMMLDNTISSSDTDLHAISTPRAKHEKLRRKKNQQLDLRSSSCEEKVVMRSTGQGSSTRSSSSQDLLVSPDVTTLPPEIKHHSEKQPSNHNEVSKPSHQVVNIPHKDSPGFHDPVHKSFQDPVRESKDFQRVLTSSEDTCATSDTSSVDSELIQHRQKGRLSRVPAQEVISNEALYAVRSDTSTMSQSDSLSDNNRSRSSIQTNNKPLKDLCNLGPTFNPNNVGETQKLQKNPAKSSKQSRTSSYQAIPMLHHAGMFLKQTGQALSSDEDRKSIISSSTAPTYTISVTSAVEESDYPCDSLDSPTSGSIYWGNGSTLGQRNQLLSPRSCSPFGSPNQDLNNDGIIFKFAAATPCESPSSMSNSDLHSLAIGNKNELSVQACDRLNEYYNTPGPPSQPSSPATQTHLMVKRSAENLTSSNLSIPSTIIPVTPIQKRRPMDLLSVETHGEMSKDSSHNSLFLAATISPSLTPQSPNFSLMMPSPGVEVPLQHLSIMKVLETWVRVCSLDLECDSSMRKEMKDFLNKMASLGHEYRTWSQCLNHTLKLEEDEKRESGDDCSNSDTIHKHYKQLQMQVLSGDLPCTREEAATLAGIQLHLEDTWPEESNLTDMAGASDDPDDLEQRHLLRMSSRDQNHKRKKVSIAEKDRTKLAPSRRSGKLTKNPLFCFDGNDGTLLCFRIPDGRMANALPPDQRRCTTICKLIEEKQTKLWHTTYYDSEFKLKQLYIKICKNLPAYNCKLYNIKEIRRGNTKRKVSCLLGVSPEKIILLDSKTKQLQQTHDIHELQEWSTGTGRNLDGLKLEFRGSKPWSLVAPSCDKLKLITGALLDVMGTENRLFDSLLYHQDSLRLGQRHHNTVCMTGSAANPASQELYTDELAELQKILHFPEEVAMRLTETEFKLFNSVPPMFYVRQVTMDLSRAPKKTSGIDVATLIQRFYEVSSWVTHLIITQPTHEDRKAVLSCILRVAQTCWNIGNFNSAVEILVGLKSEKLKPFWLSIEDEDLSQLEILSSALLAQMPTEEYRLAITRALNLNGCQVVPFFGAFLRDLQMILNGIPSLVVLPPNGESRLKLVSEFKGEDRFVTRIGVGGLINMEKVHQAHCVLTDIHLFHKHAQKQMPGEPTDDDLQHLDLLSHQNSIRDLDGREFEDEVVPDLDLGHYDPICSIGNEHQVMMIPSSVTHPYMHNLQSLHHGATAIHWDSKDSHSVVCFLKLENDNSTLSWSKTNWSSLRGTSVSLPPDYIFQGEEDRRISSPLINRYISGSTYVEEIEEGQLDLLHVKSVTLTDASVDIGVLQRKHNISTIEPKQNCIVFLVGNSISENRLLEFVLPPLVLKSWFNCLKKLVDAGRYIRQRQIDRRIMWLKDLYLQLYYEGEACLAPTSADAIRSFGGRNWNTEVNLGMGSETALVNKKNTSPVGSMKSAKTKKKNFSLPAFRDHSPKLSQSSLQDQSTVQDQRSRQDLSKSSKSSKTTSKSPQHTDNKSSQSKHKVNVKTIFHPESLTFGFQNRGLPSRDWKRFSLRSQLQESTHPITHVSQFNFLDFVQLFKCFYVLLRKDIKELFEEFAVSNPESYMMAPHVKARLQGVKCHTGILTQNVPYIEQLTKEQHKFYDMLCSASIMENRVDSGKEKCLGIKELTDFLVEYQEENPTADDIMMIIMKHEQDPEYRSQCLLTFEGFCRYLVDQDNYAFLPEKISQHDHDMDHPMSHYYINASHNTYLTGHQLKGESTVVMYNQILLMGCRCVELDCWDGDEGEPIIYHGHTLTTKIPFRNVVEAINTSAFVTSPYPVILSLENHCSIPQQQKMAQIFLEVFGDKLVRDFLLDTDFSDPILPSPNNLKYKILIKNKKIRNPETPLSARYKSPSGGRLFTMDTIPNDEEEEEDEEDEEDFLADSGVKDIHSLQSAGLMSLDKCLSVDNTARGSINTHLSDLSREIGGSTGCLQLRKQESVSPSSLVHMRAKSMSHLAVKLESEQTLVTTLPSTPATPLDRKANSIDNYLDSISTQSSKNTNSKELLRYNSAHDLIGTSYRGMFFLDKNSEYCASSVDREIAGESNPSIGPISGTSSVAPNSSNKSWLGSLLSTRKDSGESEMARRARDSPRGATTGRDKLLLEKEVSRTSSDDQRARDAWKSRPKSEPGIEWGGSDDRDSDHAMKPIKRKKVAIAQELSDLVIYTQAIKFKGLVHVTSTVRQKKTSNRRSVLSSTRASSMGNAPSPTDKSETFQRIILPVRKMEDEGTPSCYQMSSLNENKAKQEFRKHPSAVISHTEHHLMRTYPAGTRIDSSNFNPIFFWAFGIQFAALNYQTEDLAMQINTAMFEQTAQSGYVLKPRVMWDRSHMLHARFNPLDKDFEGYQPISLKIHLISGQYLCPNHRSGSPQVEIEILGIPVDCVKHKSKTIHRNQLNPIWNELYTFQVHFQDLAFIRCTVTETTSGHVTGQRIIPLKCLRPGFRHVRLRNTKNQPLEMSTLFIYSRLEDDVSHDLMTFAVNPAKKEMTNISSTKTGVFAAVLEDARKSEKESRWAILRSKFRKAKKPTIVKSFDSRLPSREGGESRIRNLRKQFRRGASLESSYTPNSTSDRLETSRNSPVPHAKASGKSSSPSRLQTVPDNNNDLNYSARRQSTASLI